MKIPTTLRVNAAAKLNLTFDVLGSRPDGYHEINTLFQSIDLEDILAFTLTSFDTGNLQVKLSLDPDSTDWALASTEGDAVFPLHEENLITQAVKRFAENSGVGKGMLLEVAVTKKIPIAAGLAGGSSNAAATLAALNYFFDQPYNRSELLQLAVDLGSDVAFCLEGGTCLGTGRGERLERLHHTTTLNFLVLKPKSIAISTPWIYKAYDEYRLAQNVTEVSARPPRSNECFKVIAAEDLEKLPALLHNVFEPVVFARYPQIASLRDSMLIHGCLSANVTGSGPTLYGLVPDFEAGKEIRQDLIDEWAGSGKSDEFDSWLTQSTNYGVRLTG
jgi:4-diphosphocytidyl-2-C-methyl-D-erythritol kinase